MAATLRGSLAAAQTAHALVDAHGLHSHAATAAVQGLSELLSFEGGRKAAINAIVCVPDTLSRLLDLIRVSAPLLLFDQPPLF